MKLSILKGLINDMIVPAQVKTVLTVKGEEPKDTAEMLITYPVAGYEGTGTLTGGESFQWSFTINGSDWFFNSSLMD